MLIVQLDGEVRYSYRYPFSAIDPQEYRWASDELILAGAWLLISEVVLVFAVENCQFHLFKKQKIKFI